MGTPFYHKKSYREYCRTIVQCSHNVLTYTFVQMANHWWKTAQSKLFPMVCGLLFILKNKKEKKSGLPCMLYDEYLKTLVSYRRGWGFFNSFILW